MSDPLIISSYPSIYAIGHALVKDIFDGTVVIQEKVDGSQFSFGVLGGELMCRSRGKQLLLDAPEKMFKRAVEVARELHPHLHPGWTYRGEYLERPKHNTLAYSRIPKNHIILFDINLGMEEYATPDVVAQEANRLGLEVVPTVHVGQVTGLEMFQTFLERESILGGCKIEGVVVKNYARFTQYKKAMMAKYVSEAFKEKHLTDWRTRNPTSSDVVDRLIAQYTSEARWQKAVQHLREAGTLQNSPRDIGLLVKEVIEDVQKEEEEEIKAALFEHFWPKIRRGFTNGLPEWYKKSLLESAFE